MPSLAKWTRKLLTERKPPAILTSTQREHWEDFGYLVLERFFDPSQVEAVNLEVERFWQESRVGPSELVIDLIGTSGARVHLHQAPVGSRQHPYKLNDLYLVSDHVRQVVLNPRLVKVLWNLLGGTPLVCN
ncbi:MAG TPA: hypothetical protein VNA21_13270, partial [Steroidobacteraceae bacterium]|nr:hypothetical protein [Steroidobacteraceae bacterium]